MRSFVFIAFVIVMAVNSALAQSIEAPTLAAGDNWEFQHIDLWSSNLASRSTRKIIGSADGYIRVWVETQAVSQDGAVAKPQVAEMTMRADLNSSTNVGGEKLETVLYKWPLEPKKHWTFRTKREMPNNVNGTQPFIFNVSNEAEVIGWEMVEVPAGKFKAIKIVYNGKVSVENSAIRETILRTVWYSPDAKTDVLSITETFNVDGVPLVKLKSQLARYQVK